MYVCMYVCMYIYIYIYIYIYVHTLEGYLAKPQPWERAWDKSVGKEDLSEVRNLVKWVRTLGL